MRNAFLFVIITLLGVSQCFGAEDYPRQPVHVIVPFAPGGTTDIVARVVSQQLTEQLGKSFVVENREGAGGRIGTESVARSAPDGYTLLMIDPSFTITRGLFKSLPFDIPKDFAPISEIMRVPAALVVPLSLNVNTLKEFIALARENPGKYNYGSGGTGSAAQLFSELFKTKANVNIVHIPYKGTGAANAALLGGHIQMEITSIPLVIPFVNSGKLRALAVTTDGTRSPALPDVPSFKEAGVPGMVIYVWFGLAGPAGMPKEIVNKLHDEVVKAIAVPSVKERLNALGGDTVGSSPEEFSNHIGDELRRWAEVIRSAGIAPE